MTFMDWLILIIAISNVILAAASVIALIWARKAIHQRNAVRIAEAVKHTFEVERVLWFNCLTEREMTALLAIRLSFTTDFLGTIQLKAESAIRILLMLRQYENAYEQFRLGQLTPSAWESITNEMKNTFKNRRSKEVFDRSHALFSRNFTDLVTSTLLP